MCVLFYHLYKRPSSFTRSIRTLISTRHPHPKEYIQSSRLDQCSLQATPAEQYVTLEIPSELISNWKREGYTHLHLGGIRLILTLHGRKGLPITARLAMLDTRFKQYQDAVIGTVLTTLHAGSVLLTFYPNFNLSLQGPNLPTTLKVQVQIQGAEQISSAKIATLHHQLVYRLQNHALDIPTPEHHSDTLMVLAESDQIPTTIPQKLKKKCLNPLPRTNPLQLKPIPVHPVKNLQMAHGLPLMTFHLINGVIVLNEMSAWIDLQMLRPGATTQSVLREFATRFTGALRDWFDSLGNYRQLQFVQLPEVSSALAVIHDQFLGHPSAVFEAARRDYLNMECCSLNAKDLDFHYKRMSLLFYKLNGFNEQTLKHVFLASLPDELQPDIQRQLTASNLSLDNISLRKIFQLAKTCLDKLCEQKQFFKELLKDKEPFWSACKKPYLQIKCK
ncbi:hypothetical protein KPL71_026377 [Citrus sinensis]|uniref:Uncharacterized protein n=1 Tax=Citrus sinensis TaxID=2711 RepID=A0ACB8HZQ3_CITSI|nr:hypothetical protein KPL71_026377 [Citrus sinensis]